MAETTGQTNPIQRELHEIKRKILGRVLMDYQNLNLTDEGKDYIVYEHLLANSKLQKLIEHELQYSKTQVDIHDFIKDIINTLDQMTFFSRVPTSRLG